MSDPAVPSGAELLDGRYVVGRRIGSGGMGVVYEAWDRQLGRSVALKTLTRTTAVGVYRLKLEYRALSDLRHPNLVRTHGLFAEHGHWFLVMDLLEGEPLSHLLERRPPVATIRELFGQIAQGLAAVHAAGRLHRDLTPANVMVTDGRAVIMDFGLASHQGIGGPGQTVVDGRVSGTPGYLAPEQAAGAEVTPKSDWYSFGVMLREGLAQHAAEDATTLEASKLQSESRSRTGLGPEVPSDLVQLCSRLLDESPGGRPAVSEVLAVLGVRADEHTSRHSLIIPRRPLGALAHGEPELRAAYRATDDEHAAVAWILGPAASGKTTLAHGFVDDLARRDDAVVLRGRCDPNEMLPYRALDGVLDALSRVLRSMTYLEARYLLPRDVDMLAALFPAFGRIGDLVPARRRRRRPLSSERMGELATRALRELLSRLSTHRPVILLLDDLQHADVESARLLASLLAPPEPPAVLVIGCARTGLRSDDEARHAFTSLLQRVPELVMRTIHLDARWSPLPSAAGQQTP